MSSDPNHGADEHDAMRHRFTTLSLPPLRQATTHAAPMKSKVTQINSISHNAPLRLLVAAHIMDECYGWGAHLMMSWSW